MEDHVKSGSGPGEFVSFSYYYSGCGCGTESGWPKGGHHIQILAQSYRPQLRPETKR